MTTILPIIAVSGTILLLAYMGYGRLVVRWLGVDPARRTPAVEREDGIDFVPAPAPVVLGGHFTAIAAAGPIVGPILAGWMFGWLPALLWIVLGAIFIGGVHDTASLFSSIRHNATSITQVVRQHMSRPAYVTFMAFVWISLVYVIIAFAEVTAASFANFQKVEMIVNQAKAVFPINGGAVVIGATAYLLLSVFLGIVLRTTKCPWWAGLVLCVALLVLIIWKAPVMADWLAKNGLSFMDTSGKDAGYLRKRWDLVLLGYCFFASVAPMWLLLQPRGVIGATFLYAALAFGVAGTLVGGLTGSAALAITWPRYRGFSSSGGFLFPFLFITIACGACSGFHAIVASGTTCKQLRRESDVRLVGYGAMLLEAMVAIFALSCVMVLAPTPAALGNKPNADVIYARGLGNFMHLLGVDPRLAVGFGLLAFSSFVFDTLDVCTRLGRYVLQEMTGLKGIAGGAVATLVTLAAPALYLWNAPAEWGYMQFWTIFGTSNQLLAALTLLGISVWLWRTGRRVWFALLPAMFMLASTSTGLVLNFRGFLSRYRVLDAAAAAREASPLVVNMAVAALLFGLAVLVVVEALRVWRRVRGEVGGAVAAGAASRGM